MSSSMHGLFFYIGLGAGLAAAAGLRPFVPALLAGALAGAGDLGVSFPRGHFHFLQSGWWLLAAVLALALAYAAQLLLGLAPTPSSERAGESSPVDPLAAALTGIAYGVGALLFAATLDAHGDAWWAGALGGLAAVWVAQRASVPVLSRARARLKDGPARAALTVYLDAAALLAAVLVAALHPLGYVLVAALAWFAWRGRGRDRGKYAGLRVLSR